MIFLKPHSKILTGFIPFVYQKFAPPQIDCARGRAIRLRWPAFLYQCHSLWFVASTYCIFISGFA